MKTLVVILALVLAPAAAAGQVRQGQHLYGEYCLKCHSTGMAPSLHGVGALAADFYLTTGYMPLHHIGAQPHRSRQLLGDQQVRALVAYIASFGGPPIPSPHPEDGDLSVGQHLFTENCAGCHQVVAQGGYVTGALPPPLEDETPLQVAEAVRIGPYVMPRFSKEQISDRQLDSIVRYVEWTKDPPHPGGWPLGYLGPIPEGLVAWFLGALALVLLCLVIGKRLR